MYIVGMRPRQGLFTKSEFLKGKMPNPGTRGADVAPDGSTREYVAVKLASGTWINGTVLTLSASITGASAAAAAPVKPAGQGGRVGVLAFATLSATQTMAGTAFGWAQIFGACIARCSATGMDSVGVALGLQGAAGVFSVQVAVTASLMLQGANAIATSAGAVTLMNVLLNYPKFVPGDELA